MKLPVPVCVIWTDAMVDTGFDGPISSIPEEDAGQLAHSYGLLVKIGTKNLHMATDYWPNNEDKPVRTLHYVPKVLVKSVQILGGQEELTLKQLRVKLKEK